MGASHNLDSLKPKPTNFLVHFEFSLLLSTHQIWAQWFSVFFCCTSPCNTDLADHVTGNWISFRNYWDVSTKWMKQGRKKLGVVYVSRSERALVMNWPHASPSVVNFVEFPQRWPRCQIIWRGLKNQIFGVDWSTTCDWKILSTTNGNSQLSARYALNTEKGTSSWVRKNATRGQVASDPERIFLSTKILTKTHVNISYFSCHHFLIFLSKNLKSSPFHAHSTTISGQATRAIGSAEGINSLLSAPEFSGKKTGSLIYADMIRMPTKKKR